LANQDYAQVNIQSDGSSLCFCVCDGVGSSYKGDFAAQYLAKCLITWMQTLTDLQAQTSALADQIYTQLNLWAHAAQEQLEQVAIPPNTPALVREVLEELRDTYGSETVFLCGRIDIVAASAGMEYVDNGPHSVQMLVCWMGNVTAQLLAETDGRPRVGTRAGTSPAPTGLCVTLGGDDDRVARWSTLQGARGPVTIWKDHLSTIDRLIVHTDGLDATASPLHKLDDNAWQAQTQLSLLPPSNDDMTVLELRWQGLAP
jgi:hypothetical protein